MLCVSALIVPAGIGAYAPVDYANMPIIFMANEGKPNVAIVSWKYRDTGIRKEHAFGLMALSPIKTGEEVPTFRLLMPVFRLFSACFPPAFRLLSACFPPVFRLFPPVSACFCLFVHASDRTS